MDKSQCAGRHSCPHLLASKWRWSKTDWHVGGVVLWQAFGRVTGPVKHFNRFEKGNFFFLLFFFSLPAETDLAWWDLPLSITRKTKTPKVLLPTAVGADFRHNPTWTITLKQPLKDSKEDITVCWGFGCKSAVSSASSGQDIHCWQKPSEHKGCVEKPVSESQGHACGLTWMSGMWSWTNNIAERLLQSNIECCYESSFTNCSEEIMINDTQ